MWRIPSSRHRQFDLDWFWRDDVDVGLTHVRSSRFRLRGSWPTSINLTLIMAILIISSVQVEGSSSRWSTVRTIQSTTGATWCPDGTYANPVVPAALSPTTESSVNSCLPCSHCGPGLYVAHPCHSTRDTVCDSCHTYRGPHNLDFQRRCRGHDGVRWSIGGRRNVTSSGNVRADWRQIKVTQSSESSSDEPPAAPPADDYRWLRVTVNSLVVFLIIALCFCAVVLYHIKRSPINGYKVITKIEDV